MLVVMLWPRDQEWTHPQAVVNILISGKATGRRSATALLNTLSPVGEQPEPGRKGITKSAEEPSLLLCIWHAEQILPPPTQRMLERLIKPCGWQEFMAPSESQKCKWHISLGQETWGSITVHRGQRRRGANTELSVGKEMFPFQPPKHFTTKNSQRSHGNFVISISHTRRMKDTVAHRVWKTEKSVSWFLFLALCLAICPISKPDTYPDQRHFILCLCEIGVKKSCAVEGLWIFPSLLLKQFLISFEQCCIYEDNLIVINLYFVKKELTWQENAVRTPPTRTRDLTPFGGLLSAETEKQLAFGLQEFCHLTGFN